MRFKFMAALLVLLPAPALADVTATYAVQDKTVTIEVEDGGNARMTVGDKVTLIRRDGVDYVAAKDAMGAVHVVRALDLLAMAQAQIKGTDAPLPGRHDLSLSQGAAETVAGYPGTVWKLVPDAGSGAPNMPVAAFDFVISADPKLAPVAAYFRHLIDTVVPMFLPMMGESNFVARADELFGHGAPIRIGPLLTLTRVETGEIADDRFTLPGPVMSAAEFVEAVDPSKAAQALPPAP
jgi:hypothetical protein